MKKFIPFLIVLGLVILTSCSRHEDASYSGIDYEQTQSLTRLEENTLPNDESKPLSNNTYRILSMDLAVPPIDREIIFVSGKLDFEIQLSDYLWLVRDSDSLNDGPKEAMGEIKCDYDEIVVDFKTDNWLPDNQYLHNLCLTLSDLKGYRGEYQARFIFLMKGEPLNGILKVQSGNYPFSYYTPIDGVGYYTAQDMRNLQKEIDFQIPEKENYFDSLIQYSSLSDEQKQRFADFMRGNGDPIKNAIAEFLYQALPGQHQIIDYTTVDFDTPANAPNEMFVLCGLQHTEMLLETPPTDELLATPKGLIWRILNSGHTDSLHYGWSAEQAEMSAKYYFGDGITIEHQGYGNKRYSYYEWSHLYSHFPGGTGGERMLTPVLDCQKNADQYEVEIALILIGGYDGIVISNGVEYVYDIDDLSDLVNYALTDAPKAKVILNIIEDNRFTIQGFHYLG